MNRFSKGASFVAILLKELRDTSIFNPSSVMLHDGASLDALLMEIPGLKIDAKGNVSISGRPVRELLIEGRRYFGTDVATGLRNIPAKDSPRRFPVPVLHKPSTSGRGRKSFQGRFIIYHIQKIITQGPLAVAKSLCRVPYGQAAGSSQHRRHVQD